MMERSGPETYPCLPWSRFMELSEVIIVIGGCDKKGLLKLPFTDLYQPKSRQWTALSSVPGYTKSEFAACTLKNDVYISGEMLWTKWSFPGCTFAWTATP